jgi:predicted  nucleic acid-binding Zn-ribbon protein
MLSLQWAESQLADLKHYLENLLEDRRKTLQTNIDALNARVSALEAQFATDKASTMAEIEARNKDLTDKLEAFQVPRNLRLFAQFRRGDWSDTHG